MANLYIIGFAQAIFFSALILTKKNKKTGDYLLAFYILNLGGNLLFTYYAITSQDSIPSWIMYSDIFYWVLLGPVLLLYAEIQTSESGQFKLRHIAYFIPLFYVIIGFSEFIFGNIQGFFFNTQPDSWLFNSANMVWMFNSPLYYIITIFVLRNHKKKIQNYYSYTKNVDFKWLYYLSNGFALFLLFMVTSIILYYFQIKLPFRSSQYTWLVMVVYIFGIGFFGYRQKGIFSNMEPLTIIEQPQDVEFKIHPASSEKDSNETEGRKTQYEKSGLNEQEAVKIKIKLLELMSREKLYLECELDLNNLAEKLKTTSNKLSQVLNEYLNKNFFDFVNEYRINDAKKYLSDPDFNNLKIISIAYDCGFNSKSTFYTLFKKQTSLTPAEYRQKFQLKGVA